MNEEERNSWYESLRGKLEIFSGIAGIVLGAIAIPLFGPIARGGPADWGIIHLLISALGPLMFALLVYHNIWFRQLSLPGALVGAIYSAVKFRGSDLYLYLYLSILAIVIRIVIGLVEARATTGRYTDFWRSFIFHPLNWGKEFGMKTLLE